MQGLPGGGAEYGQPVVTKTEPTAEEGNAGAGGQLGRGSSNSRVTRRPSFTMKMLSKMSAHVSFKTPRRPSKTHLSSSPSPQIATVPPTAKPPAVLSGGTRGAVAYLLQVPNPFLHSLPPDLQATNEPPSRPTLAWEAPCRPRAAQHQHRMLRPFLALQPPPHCHTGFLPFQTLINGPAGGLVGLGAPCCYLVLLGTSASRQAPWEKLQVRLRRAAGARDPRK